MEKDEIIGVFLMVTDVLHTSHTDALIEASNNCDKLIVLLNCIPNKGDTIQSIFGRYMQLNAVKRIYKVIPYVGEEGLEKELSCLDYNIRF